MTATLLDFSQRRELTLHGSIAAAVEAAAIPLGVQILIVGAIARDLHLLYGYGIEMQRETKDIDFALAVADWNTFETLKRKLIASGDFLESQSSHRLRHRSQLPIDLVPFGRVESTDRKVAMLGHDVCLLLDNDGIRRVEAILLDETQSSPSVLPNQMNADDPGRAEALLAAMLRGLQERQRM
jgi:predicted nucleotidyltransferase